MNKYEKLMLAVLTVLVAVITANVMVSRGHVSWWMIASWCASAVLLEVARQVFEETSARRRR